MDIVLSPIEARVLGCLVEKEITTPDYYPLTLNALTAACNQKSSREPIMSLDEKDVVRALDDLRYGKKLASQVSVYGSRVPKYKHEVLGRFNFSPKQLAVLCVLLLRGPQTLGEIHSRTTRLCAFDGLTEVEAALSDLAQWGDGPLVIKLSREAGRRECRYAHLLCGQPEVSETPVEPPPEAARLAVESDNARIAELERQVALLQKETAFLKEQFQDFKRQFE